MPLFDDSLFDGSNVNMIPYPPTPPDGYLGRFQQGQIVSLFISPVDVGNFPTTPDVTPTVLVQDPGSNTVVSRPIAMTTDSKHFGLDLFLGFNFQILGRYNIEYTYVVAGVTTTAPGSFDLIGGGDGAGKVISLISYVRPESDYIVAQTDGGRLMQGRNPKLN